MTTVDIPNFPPITLEELRSAGIQWNPQRGLGPMPTWMPVTQEDKDHLGVIRNRKLRHLKIMVGISTLLSVLCISLGVSAILLSAPEYNFPHSMGGGAIVGAVVLLYCLFIVGMIREGRKTPTGDTTTSCFRCLTICNTIFISFLISFVLGAIGMGGIWATIDCAKRTPEDDTEDFTINSCTPNTGSLYTLAVLTLLFGSVLFVLFLTMTFMICCNYRAFGMKSNYEMFSDYQMVRMQAMTVQMQQTQPQQPQYSQHQFPTQGQGQVPVRGHFPAQDQGHQQEPSAPMLPRDYSDTPGGGYAYPAPGATRDKDALPSYSEVIQSGKYDF